MTEIALDALPVGTKLLRRDGREATLIYNDLTMMWASYRAVVVTQEKCWERSYQVWNDGTLDLTEAKKASGKKESPDDIVGVWEPPDA